MGEVLTKSEEAEGLIPSSHGGTRTPRPSFHGGVSLTSSVSAPSRPNKGILTKNGNPHPRASADQERNHDSELTEKVGSRISYSISQIDQVPIPNGASFLVSST